MALAHKQDLDASKSGLIHSDRENGSPISKLWLSPKSIRSSTPLKSDDSKLLYASVVMLKTLSNIAPSLSTALIVIG